MVQPFRSNREILIKSPFVIMLHQIWNLKYFMHLKITNFISLDPFILAINLNALSSFNVFSILIFMFR